MSYSACAGARWTVVETASMEISVATVIKGARIPVVRLALTQS